MNRGMDLQGLTDLLRSKSQIARVLTERWAENELYCVACLSQKLRPTKVNTPGVDFSCPECGATYQLKSASKSFGRKLLGASYAATVKAYESNQAPHMLLLHYLLDPYLKVVSLTLIPAFSIPFSAIQQRPPLKAGARRAGWVGCNIVLEQIPATAKLSLVLPDAVIASDEVRKGFTKLKPLGNLKASLRGWTLDVLHVIQELPGKSFLLADVYAYEQELAKKHPGNRNIRPKIRQQLQILRDIGLISFRGRGAYAFIDA